MLGQFKGQLTVKARNKEPFIMHWLQD